jgi:MoaA/NifB/PqqE/SkfB family radical SAM enzyme
MQLNNDDNLLLENIIYNSMTKNKDVSIELVIRPDCDQKCDYCYLKQYGKDSYPVRATKQQIIHNTNLLIDYFIEKEYLIKRFDLFAGDMFYDNLFFDIIPIMYRYYKWIYDNHKDFIEWHHS